MEELGQDIFYFLHLYCYMIVVIGFIAVLKSIVTVVGFKEQKLVIVNTILITLITTFPLWIAILVVQDMILPWMLPILQLLIMAVEVLMYRYCYRDASLKRIIIICLLVNIIMFLINMRFYDFITFRPEPNLAPWLSVVE